MTGYTPEQGHVVWDSRATRRGEVRTVCSDALGTKVYVEPLPGDPACGWWTDPEHLALMDTQTRRAPRRRP